MKTFISISVCLHLFFFSIINNESLYFPLSLFLLKFSKMHKKFTLVSIDNIYGLFRKIFWLKAFLFQITTDIHLVVKVTEENKNSFSEVLEKDNDFRYPISVGSSVFLVLLDTSNYTFKHVSKKTHHSNFQYHRTIPLYIYSR